MNAKTKKILIIIGFIILVLFLAFLLYLVFFKKPAVVEPVEEPPIEILPRLPVIPNGDCPLLLPFANPFCERALSNIFRFGKKLTKNTEQIPIWG